MKADHFADLEAFESNLWKIADNLRANSNLASNEYFLPILGLIFLRHATNRYYEASAAIEADKAAGKMPDRPLVEADFARRRALNLPERARFDVILKNPKDGNLGAALTSAMEAIEAAFPPLAGQLPKDYRRFAGSVLEEMMRMFDSEGLRTASGDVFERIYEYYQRKYEDIVADYIDPHLCAITTKPRNISRPIPVADDVADRMLWNLLLGPPRSCDDGSRLDSFDWEPTTAFN
jgi:type I restriction enzyme M protein